MIACNIVLRILVQLCFQNFLMRLIPFFEYIWSREHSLISVVDCKLDIIPCVCAGFRYDSRTEYGGREEVDNFVNVLCDHFEASDAVGGLSVAVLCRLRSVAGEQDTDVV